MKTLRSALLRTGAVLGISFILILGNVEQCRSQNAFAYDQVSFLFEETGIGARAIALGGAYMSVANDYSAIYWNPAGLGLIRVSEVFVSLTHNSRNIDTRFLGIDGDNNLSKTAVGALGFAYSFDVYRGSMVIAGGYNRLHNYNSLFGYSGFNPGQSYMDFAFETPVVPDRLTQDESLEISGNIAQVSLGGAYQAAENLFLGATVNYWTGQNNFNLVYSEFDLDNFYSVFPDDFDAYKNNRIIDTFISGFDIVFGALFKFDSHVNVGITINSPRYITLEEDWSDVEDIVFDDAEVVQFADNGIFEYKVRMPFVFGLGASYEFPRGLISGEVRYTDWSQFEFRNDFPIDGITKSDANRNIRRTVEGILSPRAGFEYVLPNNTKLRAGFSFVPNPLENSRSENNRKYVSFGLGFLLSGAADIDIAYRRGWWETDILSEFSNEFINEKHTDNRIFTSLKFKF